MSETLDYDSLAAKLADAERVARYETDIAQQALDQMKAEKARAEAAEVKLAEADERIAWLDCGFEQAMADTRAAEQLFAKLEAKLPTVYLLGLADAAWVAAGIASQYVGYMSRVEKGICALPTPTTAELMARINEGEKE